MWYWYNYCIYWQSLIILTSKKCSVGSEDDFAFFLHLTLVVAEVFILYFIEMESVCLNIQFFCSFIFNPVEREIIFFITSILQNFHSSLTTKSHILKKKQVRKVEVLDDLIIYIYIFFFNWLNRYKQIECGKQLAQVELRSTFPHCNNQ